MSYALDHVNTAVRYSKAHKMLKLALPVRNGRLVGVSVSFLQGHVIQCFSPICTLDSRTFRAGHKTKKKKQKHFFNTLAPSNNNTEFLWKT